MERANETAILDQLIPAVIADMETYFGGDLRRRNHAHKVLDFARRLNVQERGDRLVVECAAVLHDIGIHEAERRHGSAAGIYQEIEGPPLAKKILERYPDVGSADLEHICRIIANHHSAKNISTLEFKVIWDADWLVNIPEEVGLDNPEKLRRCVSSIFRTRSGRLLAESLYLKKAD